MMMFCSFCYTFAECTKCISSNCEKNYCDICKPFFFEENGYCTLCISYIKDSIYFYIDINDIETLDLLLIYFNLDKNIDSLELFYYYSLFTSSSKIVIGYFMEKVSDEIICTGFLHYGIFNSSTDIVKFLIERILKIYNGKSILLLVEEVVENLEIKEYIDFRIWGY
jgi:hypothetical protein